MTTWVYVDESKRAGYVLAAAATSDPEVACRLPPSQRPVLPTSFIQARSPFPHRQAGVSVPIAPDIPTVVPDPWTVVIPCSRLLHDLG